uniref:Uncharacterized protein n=1 Tax=Anguilla anguilla TaxID=7936 RepID=A0A0E9TJT2_ANGAN
MSITQILFFKYNDKHIKTSLNSIGSKTHKLTNKIFISSYEWKTLESLRVKKLV